jgi:hypothetical protein
LSDGTEIELVKDGKSKQVTFQNREDFIQLVIQTRLYEAKTQIRWLREGLAQMIPDSCLSLMRWFELEKLVCGSPEVDIEFLKDNTNYSVSLTAIVLY